MKYKVEMPKDWKSTFTVEQLDEIRRVKTDKDENLPGVLEMFAEIMANGEKILSVTFEWCRNGEDSFYENGVDIWCEMWSTDSFLTVHHCGATFSKLNTVGAASVEEACSPYYYTFKK